MNKKRLSIILFLLLVAVIGVFTLTSCSKKTLTLTVETVPETYDGTAKSVTVSSRIGVPWAVFPSSETFTSPGADATSLSTRWSYSAFVSETVFSNIAA